MPDTNQIAMGGHMAAHVLDAIYGGSPSEEHAQEVAGAMLDAILEAEPALRERFSDALLTDLKEAIGKDDTAFSHECVGVIEDVEREWRQDA